MSHYGLSHRPSSPFEGFTKYTLDDLWSVKAAPAPAPTPTAPEPAPPPPPEGYGIELKHTEFKGRTITLKEALIWKEYMGEGQEPRPTKLLHSEAEKSNHLIGQKGANNLILGLEGQQYMYSGTTEAEGGKTIFGFASASDSPPDRPDSINNFVVGKDKIDVSNLTPEGMSGLTFVDEFTGTPGEAMLTYLPGEMLPHVGTSYLSVDTDGDGVADFKLKIHKKITQSDITS